MNQENRVLSRQGARELTQEEANNVQGGLRTLTVCTFGVSAGSSFADGDPGEC